MQIDMSTAHIDIPEQELLSRLERADEVRCFFVQMWRENPDLLRHSDPRLREIMQPVWQHEKNATAVASEPTSGLPLS